MFDMADKSSIKIFVLIILLFVNITSCRSYVEDLPYFEAVPVVNSFLIAGKPITISVSYADLPDTLGIRVCDNATVNLYIDDSFAEMLVFDEDESVYVSDLTAEAEKYYACEVIIPNYDTLFAETFVPKPSVIENPEIIVVAGIDNEGRSYPSVKFTFNTNPDDELYFHVVIKRIRLYDPSREYPLYNSLDPIILHEGLNYPVFSNEIIDEDFYTINLSYFTGSYGSATNPYSIGGTVVHPIFVELRSVSEDYYHFIKQYYLFNDYLESIGEIMTGPVQPVQMYSNVTNGYGVFAGLSVFVTDTIFPPGYTYN